LALHNSLHLASCCCSDFDGRSDLHCLPIATIYMYSHIRQLSLENLLIKISQRRFRRGWGLSGKILVLNGSDRDRRKKAIRGIKSPIEILINLFAYLFIYFCIN
uniref:Uncharacterized protein n=1 Tax=Parascaris univalens TaxID=6257 RepID=A0A915C2P2_PARUN